MAIPTLLVPPPQQHTQQNVNNIAKEFQCGIKQDAMQFIAFKDEAAWDNWSRSTIAQA